MTAKTSAARRAAFFAALAETGNQTLAAERARVSRSWVVLRRRTDTVFRRDLEAAVATARARLATSGNQPSDARWRDQHGHELIVRGGNGRPIQVQRARLSAITPRVEARFIAALSGCCNVLAACRQVGITAPGAYDHRKRWPVFAERWDAAINEGYDRLSHALVASAGQLLGDKEMVPEPVLTVTCVAEALQVLSIYKSRKQGRSHGRRPRPRTLDEVRGSILKKLEAIAGHARHERRERIEAHRRDEAARAMAMRKAGGVKRVRRRWRPGGPACESGAGE